MKSLLSIMISGIFLLATPSFSDIINVPADTSRIQDAISVAEAGDTVLVAEGTYYENISFMGKAITVGSHFIVDGDTTHVSKTIIDGSTPSDPDSGSVVFFVSGEDSNAVLCGFTITGGTGTKTEWEGEAFYNGGGILIFLSGGKVINNKIVNNSINKTDMYCYSGGIDVTGEFNLFAVIRDNEIAYNNVYANWGGGGGVSLYSRSRIVFTSNFVHHNLFVSQGHAHGGGIGIGGSNSGEFAGRIDLISNIITENKLQGQSTSEYGGGVYSEGPDVLMVGNVITNNVASYGGGVCVLSLSSFKLTAKTDLINNTITGNTGIDAGALWNRQSNVSVLNSILWGNIGNQEVSGQDAKTLYISFSDVAGGWIHNGEGNVDLNPEFSDTVYCYLGENSPCIDAGDSSAVFFDHEDPLNPGFAFWPAMGTLRNDMGAYGGTGKLLTTIDTEHKATPVTTGYLLSQNYPNPFNPSTTIEFTLPKSEYTQLKVYNILGKEVSTLVSKDLNQGKHTCTFDGKNLASGVYYYQLVAGAFSEVKKMILLR